MKGRIPKPTSIKKLEGMRKDRINENEPKPNPSRPTCPSHLNTPAKTEWRRIVPELATLGLLSQLDRAALAGYCQAWGRWVEAERKLKELSSMSPDKMEFLYKTTNGNLIINPLLSVANKAQDQMHKFLIEFGMTPSSRSRIVAEPREAKDPMEELLKESRNN